MGEARGLGSGEGKVWLTQTFRRGGFVVVIPPLACLSFRPLLVAKGAQSNGGAVGFAGWVPWVGEATQPSLCTAVPQPVCADFQCEISRNRRDSGDFPSLCAPWHINSLNCLSVIYWLKA